MEIMNNLISLNLTTKESDDIPCENCNKGIYVPRFPKNKINHLFSCNHCGTTVHIEANVTVE